MSSNALDRHRALLAQATPGPWPVGFLYWTLRVVIKHDFDVWKHMDGSDITDEESARCPSKEDAEFIAAAVNAHPLLLDLWEEVRRYRKGQWASKKAAKVDDILAKLEAMP